MLRRGSVCLQRECDDGRCLMLPFDSLAGKVLTMQALNVFVIQSLYAALFDAKHLSLSCRHFVTSFPNRRQYII